MPGGYPLTQNLCNASAQGIAGNYPGLGTTLTPSASANTKGSYSQLVASTPSDANWIELQIRCNGNVAGCSLWSVDIAVGAAASERIIVADLVMDQGQSGGNGSINLMLPIHIPAGTRISARCQVNVAASDANCTAAVRLYEGAWEGTEGSGGSDTIGFVSASTHGTSITAGNGSKGSWTALTTSSAADYAGFSVGIDFLGNGAGASFNHFRVDIGIGGAGSEQVIMPDQCVFYGAFGFYNGITLFTPIQIPAGTRISARAQTSSAGVNMGITLYGVYL